MLYWLFIHSALTITERHRHGYDVFPDSNRKVPFGSGATCLYNYQDIMVKNNTDLNFQLSIKIEDDYLVGKLLCEREPLHTYQVYEKEHYFKHELWGAYTRHNLIHRHVLNREGLIIDDEFVVENHAIMMYVPFVESTSQQT
jgi:vancomycin resistance protein VanW